jgi:hypothetical protein
MVIQAAPPADNPQASWSWGTNAEAENQTAMARSSAIARTMSCDFLDDIGKKT